MAENIYEYIEPALCTNVSVNKYGCQHQNSTTFQVNMLFYPDS